MTLTKKQKEAVESNAGTTLVIAGPGTGKTHILASRIQYLVEKKSIAPGAILCLTFTTSAATSMRERVISFLGPEGYRIDINTFHGFSSRLIDEHPEIFGYRRNLRALTDIDRAQLIKKIIEELYTEGTLKELITTEDKYFYYRDIARALSTLKREGFDEDAYEKAVREWAQAFESVPEEKKFSTSASRAGKLKIEYEKEQKRIAKNDELVLIYRRYQQHLQDSSQYDYEDMILNAERGIRSTDEIRQDLHKKYKAILVDEYQDTNGAQNKLLFALIPEKNQNIFVVGDDDQAIHRFQGATTQNFIEFTKHFPETRVVSLQDNFRSPQIVLDAALALAKGNKNRLTTQLKMPDKILKARSSHAQRKTFSINEFPDESQEHAYLVESIKKLKKDRGRWSAIALLTRTNREQQQYAELFRQNGIPYSLSADHDALTEPRTTSLFWMVRACMNPQDDEAVLRFLRHKATPIKTEDVYLVLSNRQKWETIYRALQKTLKNNKDEFADAASAQKTFFTLTTLSSLQETMSGAHWLQEIIQQSGFLSWILKQEDASYVIANVRALTDEAKRIQAGNPHITMADMLEHFESYRTLNMPLKPSAVHLAPEDTVGIMTVHQAKGREFDYVFIPHAVEGSWSGKRTIDKLPLAPEVPPQKETEEDARRLFYVALTRVKKNLSISYAKTYSRGLSGLEEKSRDMVPTLFITELASHVQARPKQTDATNLLVASITPPERADNAEKNIIKKLVERPDFALNTTSLNTFLECSQKFLFESVLRVPKIKTFSLTYGEVVHIALERYFKQHKSKRTIDGLMETVQVHLDTHSTLNEAENRRIFERAEITLTNYLPKLQNEPDPIEVEYYFPKDKFSFGDVRVSGKIDKISPLSKGAVKIIDYKTSKKAKTLNAIMGRTQDKHAPNLMRQLLFYKLLLEYDQDFSHIPEEFSLDFVDAGREITVPITDELYKKFQKQIKNVWKHIQTLAFLESSDEFPHCGECVYCTLAV